MTTPTTAEQRRAKYLSQTEQWDYECDHSPSVKQDIIDRLCRELAKRDAVIAAATCIMLPDDKEITMWAQKHQDGDWTMYQAAGVGDHIKASSKTYPDVYAAHAALVAAKGGEPCR